MEEVYVNVKNTMLEELFDKDLVSIEELFGKAEDLKCEVDELREKIEDNEQQIEDFYKPKSPYEIYGVSEKDFI